MCAGRQQPEPLLSLSSLTPAHVSPVVTRAGVTKAFANHHALDEVFVTILPGEFVAVIGMVGGGGIGFYLWETIRFFNDREAATVILLIVVMVMCIDIVSARLRRVVI